MGVVDEAIQNGIREGGIAEGFVPVFHGELTGDDGGAIAVPVIEEFQLVAALFIGQRAKTPVVEDHDVGFGEGGQQFARCDDSSGVAENDPEDVDQEQGCR